MFGELILISVGFMVCLRLRRKREKGFKTSGSSVLLSSVRLHSTVTNKNKEGRKSLLVQTEHEGYGTLEENHDDDDDEQGNV